MKLRRYQEDGLRAILEYAAEHPRGRALLVMAPRAGKTLVATMAAKLLAPRGEGLRVLWIAPSVETLEGAVDHIVASGIPRDQIGIIYRDRPTSHGALWQVATEATIDRRTKPEADVVVWDEAHHDAAMRRRRIRALYPYAFHLGSTGTPERLTGAGLDEDYDILICPVQPSELIHDGHLAVPTVFAPEPGDVPKLSKVRVRRGDYDTGVLERMMLSREYIDTMMREWERLAEGRRTLVYPVTVKHSLAIVKHFRRRHVNAFHIDGDTKLKRRAEILDWLRAGEVLVVSSVGTMSEGVDLPEVKCVVQVRATRSRQLHIQQGSRCMTPWRGVRPRILDLVNNCGRLGFPFDDQDWTLARKSKAPGHGAAGEPMVKRCVCGALASRGALVCSECEAPFADWASEPDPLPPVKLREVQFTAEDVAARRVTIEDLAKRRGFASAWVDKVLAAVVGEVMP